MCQTILKKVNNLIWIKWTFFSSLIADTDVLFLHMYIPSLCVPLHPSRDWYTMELLTWVHLAFSIFDRQLRSPVLAEEANWTQFYLIINNLLSKNFTIYGKEYYKTAKSF